MVVSEEFWTVVEVVQETEVGRYSKGFDSIRPNETIAEAKKRITMRLNQEEKTFNKNQKRNLTLIESMCLTKAKRVW